jgi:hypothetical protein
MVRLRRLTIAAAFAGAVWLAAQYSWPWLAGLVSFGLVLIVSSVISARVPSVIERVGGTDPLNVTVGADVGFYSDGWSVVLPHDVDRRSRPPEGIEHLQARNHLFEAGAYDLRETHLLLMLEGRSVDPVRITGIRSRVVARADGLSGAVIVSPSAGEQRIVATYFDLEQDQAPARSEDGHEYFRDYTLTLGRGESLVYTIIARAERSACEWEIVLNYSHRGVDHERVVDHVGQPFRTAATSKHLAGAYEWAWHTPPPRLVRRSAGNEGRAARGDVVG